jgi:hypothetical protein
VNHCVQSSFIIMLHENCNKRNGHTMQTIFQLIYSCDVINSMVGVILSAVIEVRNESLSMISLHVIGYHFAAIFGTRPIDAAMLHFTPTCFP